MWGDAEHRAHLLALIAKLEAKLELAAKPSHTAPRHTNAPAPHALPRNDGPHQT